MAVSYEAQMRMALRLARHGYGSTSPNPMVGALLVRRGRIIGRGWHRRSGEPHAEIEALRDAARRGHSTQGATLVVTLEPCSTQGRTPPCTNAIVEAGIQRVVVGATDPNPKHAGRGFALLRKAGIEVVRGVLDDACARLNEAFNHWIVHRTPWVTVKAAMTLDGRIATPSGESKWITGEQARAVGMHLRRGSDAILVGVNTILADDPSLTVRLTGRRPRGAPSPSRLRRIVLDAKARTPLSARVVADEHAQLTTLVVSRLAPRSRVAALAKRVRVVQAPLQRGSTPSGSPRVDLRWLLRRLGGEEVARLLVEGGGEVVASFLEARLAHRISFFYAPKVLGGSDALRAVGGVGASCPADILRLTEVEWRRVGQDLLLAARLD